MEESQQRTAAPKFNNTGQQTKNRFDETRKRMADRILKEETDPKKRRLNKTQDRTVISV